MRHPIPEQDRRAQRSSIRQAEALARVTAAQGALYIVNDDAALCVAVGAGGVHLGEDDGGVAAAREIVGPECIIGASCYNDFRLAEAAVAAGADYVAFGSFFPSGVKPAARRADITLIDRAAALSMCRWSPSAESPRKTPVSSPAPAPMPSR